MATLATQNPTMADVAKRMDPNGKIDKIVEILSQTNDILAEMTVVEANDGTSHKSTIRTGLPQPTWRKLYGGVQPTKSTTAQVVDSTGMLEAYAEVDKALADLNGNTAEFRLSEDTAHIEGMNQEMAQTLFYGNQGTEPEAFTGLAPRYNALTAGTGDNVLDGGAAGGQTDCTSIWLLGWSPLTIHAIYPKGSKAGLSHTDKGQVTLENVDGNGGRMEAYRSHYRWDMGLVVRDWRYAVRIANIDVSTLTKNAGSGADLIDLMTTALEIPPSLGMARFAWYANRTITSFLRRQTVNKVASSTLAMEEIAGRKVTTFGGIPVRRCDALLNTETKFS